MAQQNGSWLWMAFGEGETRRLGDGEGVERGARVIPF